MNDIDKYLDGKPVKLDRYKMNRDAKMVIFHILKIDKPWVYVMIYAGYIPAYLIIAKDILYGAYKNIRHARFFDEMFLMALATIIALLIGYYDEALFLVIFYTICEMCQQYAINYSRKSIAGLASLKTEVANVEINGQRIEMNVDGIVVGDIIYVVTLPSESSSWSAYLFTVTSMGTASTLDSLEKSAIA